MKLVRVLLCLRIWRFEIAEQTTVEQEMLLGHVCGTKYDVNHVIGIPVSESGAPWPISLTFKESFSDMRFICKTPLMIAAALGQVDIARSLIEHGAPVDDMDSDSNTPLHIAAKEGQLQVIELLIFFGANVNSTDVSLWTPCMIAAGMGHLASVQALVRGGADLTLQDEAGWTAVNHVAAHSRSLDVIVFLIHKMKDSEIFADTKDGDTMFENSAWAYPPYQSFLLNLAPNPSVYESRQSNIMSAIVQTNNPINLKRLLRRLPRPLIPTLLAHRARLWGTPLYSAATRPSEKVIDMLLNAGADLDLVGGDHGTPLMGACAAGRLGVVKILVSKGAKTSYIEDGKVFSVLCAAKHHPKITRWLLVGRFAEGPLVIENGGV